MPRLRDSDRPGMGMVTHLVEPGGDQARGQTVGLVAEDESQGPGEVGIGSGGTPPRGERADAHQTQVSEHAEHLLWVTAFDDRHMEESPRPRRGPSWGWSRPPSRDRTLPPAHQPLPR